MQCPFCAQPETRVIDSRLAADGFQVRRRRECAACSERFTTYETAELVMPHVRKRSGEVVPFDEQRLRLGLERALYKRPVSSENTEAAVNHILHKLRTMGEREVSSQKVGEWVMEELRDLDQVAFVRFASIYRQFEDVSDIRREIDSLESQPTREFRKIQLDLIDDPDK